MLPRFHLIDFSTAGHHLGTVLVVCGILMLVPAGVAGFTGELSCVSDYLAGAGVTVFVGALLRLLKYRRLDRKRSLLLCGAGWIAAALFCAIPLYLSNNFNNYFDAFFDSVSALTTTGVSLLPDVEHLSNAQVTWRALMSLGGGLSVVIIALYLGFFGEGGYSARENARVRHDSMSHSLMATGKFLWVVAGSIMLLGTVIVAVLLFLKGLTPADALLNGFWLTSGAYSTTSFIPHASNLVFYHSKWLNAFLAAVMLLGGLSYGVFGMVLHGKARLAKRNSEFRAYVVWIVVLVLLITVILCREGLYTTGAGLFNQGGFMVISAATTSGMQTVYPQQMGKSFVDGALIIVMVAMFVGTCSASSGGGMKIFRAMQLVRWFVYTVKRALLPDRVHVKVEYFHYGTKQTTSGDATLAMTITSLYIGAVTVGSMLFIGHGYEPLAAVFEALSYVTNGGMDMGVVPSTMSLDLKIMTLLLMFMGRLEFITIIAVVFGLLVSLDPRRSRTVIALRKSLAPKNTQEKALAASKTQKLPTQRTSMGKHSRKKKHATLPGKGAQALLLCLALVLAAAPLARAAELGPEVSASQLPQQDAIGAYRTVAVEELLNATARMDGELISLSGEVVGSALWADGDHAWINLTSNGKTIGVFVDTGQVEEVKNWGGYCTRGDTVMVRGTFHLACPLHAGELEIHAASFQVTSGGYSWTKRPSASRAFWGGVLLVVGLVVVAAEKLARIRGGIRYRLRHALKRRYNARGKHDAERNRR